jgi:hypothetical protein
MRVSQKHAVILMSDGRPQIWPARGRSIEELEAFCATCGATVLDVYPSLEDAEEAVNAMDDG